MSEAGKNNFKGTTYQAKVAFLLFLSKLEDSNLKSITLEDSEWEDFTLNHNSGKKIVCEAKNYSKALSKSQLKTILNTIENRPQSLGPDDELMIICPSVNKEIYELLQSKMPRGLLADKLRSLKFNEQQTNLLLRTSFFCIDDKKVSQEIFIYFYSKIGYWLPREEIEGLLNTVLYNEIYTKSASSETFSRIDLQEAIENYKELKIQHNGSYDTKQTAVSEQIHTILENIRNKKHVNIKRDLTPLSGQPELMYIVLESIFKDPNLLLSDWDFLWKSLLNRQYAISILQGFREHVKNEANADYLITLLTDEIHFLTSQIINKYVRVGALELIRQALKIQPNCAPKAFGFAKQYLSRKQSNYFELDHWRVSHYEQEPLSKLLNDIYSDLPEDSVIQDDFIQLIGENFTLVEDDGEFAMFTPKAMFEIYKKYINLDFERNFVRVVSILITQFEESRFYNGSFDGWELIGGIQGGSGNQFSLKDRHFISLILLLSLMEFYQQAPLRAWEFILTRCVALKSEGVSASKPDFLGRTAIPLLIAEFQTGEKSKQAEQILKQQLLIRRGIPGKFELIFQELLNNPNISDDKIWRLLHYFLTKFSLPVTVFEEQLVLKLAIRGHDEALSTIVRWAGDPLYRKKRYFTVGNFMESQALPQLMNSDKESTSFKIGIEILHSYLNSDSFFGLDEAINTFDVAKIVAQIVERDIKTGVEFLKRIASRGEGLQPNLESVLCQAVELIGNSSPEIVGSFNSLFVRPLLFDNLLGDISRIEKQFYFSESREAFVKYALSLAKANFMHQALEIVRIFVEDSDPLSVGSIGPASKVLSRHQQILSGNDPQIIGTVRGWCAWVLGAFSKEEGKPYIPQVIKMVEELSRDADLFVRAQSTFGLMGLLRNRHSLVVGAKGKERFMSLSSVSRLEKIAFRMLREQDNLGSPVMMKYLQQVFGEMRSMSVPEALEMFEAFNPLELGNDSQNIITLLVYYALFRKTAYQWEGSEKLLGAKLFSKVNDFDELEFRILLKHTMENGEPTVRRQLAWQFWQMPKAATDNFEALFAIAREHLSILCEKYDRSVFELVYYFIKDFVDLKPRDCLSLWQHCIQSESLFLESNWKNMYPHEWWPCHDNQLLLTKLNELEGEEEYLRTVSTLLRYPRNFSNGIDPRGVHNQLRSIGSSAVAILKVLRDTYPFLYGFEDDSSSK